MESHLHYVSHGQGPVVVLIHGLFGDSDNLKNLASALEASFTVIRIDVPNHGLSPHSSTMTYPVMATQIKQLLDHLKIETAYLVGHSMGGKIAMATALAFPNNIAGLIVADIAPVPYPNRHDKVFNALLSLPLSQIQSRKSALDHLLNQQIDPATAQFLLKSLTKSTDGFKWKMNVSGLKQNYPDIVSWHNTDASYPGPCLFIRGGNSDYVTLSHRQAILKQFPQVEAKTIEGAGHWLHAEKASVFNRLVCRFLDKTIEAASQ